MSGFEQHVAQRLAAGAVAYHDRGYQCPLDELIAEQLEECADLAGWGRISATVLAGRDDLEECEVEEIAAALHCAENHARQAWARLDGALRIVRAAS
jgi:hypothetical protein